MILPRAETLWRRRTASPYRLSWDDDRAPDLVRPDQLSGRYNAVVYAINIATGSGAPPYVEKGPHGLCVWPQPGSYSLGHTGILR